ncbi:hypothetical protein [Aristophania vespae]|uniref:hypothetical protein n=1 Tax=Aristophania vespae TaxID=2697033 RepID=UPI002351259D|nr:hypothetical protein [Aristophania vespae]UMM63115.1 hypothetical protein DM15PD_00690 [Aristophania vespae]
MSVQTPTSWAWEHKVDPITLLVLLALADMADDLGIIWDAPYWVLSEKTGLHQTTIGKRIRLLGDIGSLQHASGGAYRLMIRRSA